MDDVGVREIFFLNGNKLRFCLAHVKSVIEPSEEVTWVDGHGSLALRRRAWRADVHFGMITYGRY